MKPEELLKRYASGERDFRGIELQEANLEGANLEGADLSNTVLCLANLNRSNLTDANLSHANLVGTDLMHTIGIRAKFTGAKVLGADLRGSNFSQADFTDALLSSSLFTRTNLQEANFAGAALSHAVLHRANLQHSNLTEANLAGADLRWANLSGAEIRRVDLIGTGRAATILPDGATCPFNLRVRDLMKAKESTLFALRQFTDQYHVHYNMEQANDRQSTAFGQMTVIKQKVASLFQLLARQDLRIASSPSSLKLMKANGQVVAIMDFARAQPKAIVRYGTEYWDVISELLLEQQFVPLGRSQKYPSFSEYEHHRLPPGYQLHFTKAKDLQSFWQAQQHTAGKSPTLLLLLERTWHPIEQLTWAYDNLIQVTITDLCLALRRTEFVTWLSLPAHAQGKVAIDCLWTQYNYL